MRTPILSHGETVDTAETDLVIGAIRELSGWFLDLLGGTPLVIGGMALTDGASTPITTVIAAGACFINGIHLTITSPVSVTHPAGDSTYPRYDLLQATWSQVTTTDLNGQPVLEDRLTITSKPGIPAPSPTLPPPDASSVQLGYRFIPAGATASPSCPLTVARTPFASLLMLINHTVAPITSTASAHGIQQGSGHSLDADTVDGFHASIQNANARIPVIGYFDTVYGPGTTPSGAPHDPVLGALALNAHIIGWAKNADFASTASNVLDQNGNLHAASTPGGGEPSRVVISGPTGRAGLATYADVAGTLTNPAGGSSPGLNVDGGQIAGQVVPAGGSLSYNVTFNRTFANPPAVDPGIVLPSPMSPVGLSVGVYNITRTTCTIQIGNATGAALLLGATWLAYGV